MNTKIHLVGKNSVFARNIIFMRAEANYSEIFLLDGQKIVLSKTLKQLEHKFSSLNFFRPHKSYLINLSHVLGFKPNENNKISLTNDFEVELSRRKKNSFMEVYLKIK